ncbi:MAG: hypothetical protein IPN76_34195 [Saprospiraceae bacterium]|nr:hypothetical protein [Saprospiraceae bacterium]
MHFEKLHKQNAMTSREKRLQQRLALIYQQIELLRRYPEEFHKALGIQGTVEWLNERLDEINDIRKKLREINEGF